jgi:hypothetical protein
MAVLVASCDKYADLWPPFFELLFRFWSDCPFPIYLLANAADEDIPGVNRISVGADTSWSEGLLLALQQIGADYVLLLLEDLLLAGPVDTPAVEAVLTWFVSSGGNYIRLNGFPPPDSVLNDAVGLVAPHTVYRTATVLSVWKRRTLVELLRPGESAWEFETAGSVRSEAYDGFYSTRRNYIPVMNAVIKGKWQRPVLRRTKALCPGFEAGSRPILDRREQALLRLRVWGNRLLYRVPTVWRKPIRALVSG